MATKMIKSSIVKSTTAKSSKTSAPKVSRTRKGEEPATTVEAARVDEAQIAARAYERFCARGFQHGHDVEDWIAAEAELAHR